MTKKEVTYEEIIEGLGDKLPSLPQILDELVKTLGNHWMPKFRRQWIRRRRSGRRNSVPSWSVSFK